MLGIKRYKKITKIQFIKKNKRTIKKEINIFTGID